tara:strand:+ start:1117 stop:1341 length:225 start_codon:yes stop_codon:yes gene_type:complete
MAITRLTKHNNHQVKIEMMPLTHTHFAALRCADCNTHIQWLSGKDFFAVLSDGDLCDSVTSSSLGKEAKGDVLQ